MPQSVWHGEVAVIYQTQPLSQYACTQQRGVVDPPLNQRWVFARWDKTSVLGRGFYQNPSRRVLRRYIREGGPSTGKALGHRHMLCMSGSQLGLIIPSQHKKRHDVSIQ